MNTITTASDDGTNRMVEELTKVIGTGEVSNTQSYIHSYGVAHTLRSPIKLAAPHRRNPRVKARMTNSYESVNQVDGF